jgi:hypothetical protein
MTTRNTGELISNRLSQNSGAQSLIEASMAWMDPLYDSDKGLLRYPHDPEQHLVRESLWYALGLVLESRILRKPGAHIERVENIVSSVLANQYNAPGRIWHGTFKVTPQEADPPDDAIIWKDYDPNWRQFVGTVLLLLRRLEGHLTLVNLVPAIDAALVRCINGEPVNRVPPTYTNIALMRAWLETECGDLINDSIRKRGLLYAREIRQEFGKHGAFAEYNSPTYYGINFFALGLWQNLSDELAEMGREINTVLWTDVSRYYHAGMKNLCGPWSRSYGMDMRKYVAALSLWIWAATDREAAPFPDSARALTHGHDFCLGPIAAFSAVAIPDHVKKHFLSFAKTRQVSQQISTKPARKADAYLAPDIMIGLESSTISFRGTEQYHPLTIHWLDSDATVNWCRLRFKGSVLGELEKTRINLKLTADNNVKSARLEFRHGIQLTGNTLMGNGLTMYLETSCELQADTDGLTIKLPDNLGEHALSITCQVNE